MKAGKIWGQTELIHANGVLEFHRIEYKKNVACSVHKHKFKWNGFFVESGKMMVKVWQEGKQEGLVDETILNAGDFMQVKPGLYHQFIGLQDGVAFGDTKALFNVGFYITDPKDRKIINRERKWSEEYAEAEWQWYLSGDQCVDKLGEIYGKVPEIWKTMACLLYTSDAADE